MELLDLAKRVKRGAKLLDKKVPNWRRTLRAHADEFNFRDGDYCVLGTLEHHSGRMRTLRTRRREVLDDDLTTFGRAAERLKLDGSRTEEFGFDGLEADTSTTMSTLDALWRAEFEK